MLENPLGIKDISFLCPTNFNLAIYCVAAVYQLSPQWRERLLSLAITVLYPAWLTAGRRVRDVVAPLARAEPTFSDNNEDYRSSPAGRLRSA